jgi:RecA-family ATPase
VTVPELDEAAIRTHVRLLHELAAPFAKVGKLVVASYGEDPTSGKSLIPKVAHFAVGQVSAMTDMIVRLSREPHRNVYAPLAVLRPDLPDGKKGQEADVVASLGLVADFDDEHAAQWPTRLPKAPNYVLETSLDRFQTFYLFQRPQPISDVKPIAVRLKAFAHCDHGPVDMSHVWRIPGTPNWPNARKAKAGRPLEPQLAKVVSPWNGARADLAELDAALPEEPQAPPDDHQTGANDSASAETGTNGADRSATEIPIALLLKLLPAWLRARIAEPDKSGDRSKTLYAVVCGLAALGFDRHVIQRVIEAHPNGVGEKYLGRNDLAREIERILVKAAAGPAQNTRGNGHDSEGWPGIGPQPWSYPEDPWEALYLPTLQDVEIPQRRWVVDQWLPALETTGFAGAGGQGKTLVAMMLATAAALGKPWFSIALPRIKVFALLCEDRRDDVHIRQVNINRLYDCEFADLENLLVYPRRSHPRNRLMIFDRDGIGHPTPFFFQLLREVTEFGAELVILDTRADLFLGNQNDEDQARTFVRLICDRIAEETGGAVLLLYHPSRSGVREGTGQSGSVQWDAAFRSRWFLEDKASEDGAAAGRHARILTRVKSNFALRDETIELKWDEGVFIRTDTPVPAGFAASAKQQKADRVFLALFDKISAQGRQLSNSHQSSNYAPRIFAQQDDREGLNLRDFERAMERLFGQNKIRMEPYGPSSRGQLAIAKVGRQRP